MPQVIPIRAVPNQVMTVQLADQPTRLAIYQKLTNVFIDVYVNDVLIIGGVICLSGVAIVRTAYLGFVGDLAFFDNQPSPTSGPSDPVYTGLGAQYPLYYFAPGELLNIDEG